jgi:hypothetical protein
MMLPNKGASIPDGALWSFQAGGEWLFAVGRCRRGLCVLGTGDTV